MIDTLYNEWVESQPSVDWCACGCAPVHKHRRCKVCLGLMSVGERVCDFDGCDEEFQPRNTQHRFCPEHQPKNKKPPKLHYEECGVLVQKASNGQKYCKVCAPKVKRRQTREWRIENGLVKAKPKRIRSKAEILAEFLPGCR